MTELELLSKEAGSNFDTEYLLLHLSKETHHKKTCLLQKQKSQCILDEEEAIFSKTKPINQLTNKETLSSLRPLRQAFNLKLLSKILIPTQ